ncbi:hypothetical protein ACN9MN_12560 [Chryseobacterium sp. S-02]|uniref:hypothetical protein n=1 Tax=Chryseobacterium sp. S-02 TaxID=3404064 RepID=UPI003CF17169
MSDIGKIIRVNALPPLGERENNVIYQVAAPGAATYIDYAIDASGDLKTPSYIPLTGTEEGKPLTKNIEVDSSEEGSVGFTSKTPSFSEANIAIQEDNSVLLESRKDADITSSSIHLNYDAGIEISAATSDEQFSAIIDTSGLHGDNYIPPTSDEHYVQRKYITDNFTSQATLDSALANYYTKPETYSKTEVDAKFSAVYRPKGSVTNFASLPSSGNVEGDVWNVLDTGANYVWVLNLNNTGIAGWDKLSETVDLTNYVTINTEQTINALKIFNGASGNAYSNGAIMVNGNGSANTIYPSIGFHQPTLYGASLQYRGVSEGFCFTDITENGFNTVKAEGFVKSNSDNNYLLLGGGSHKPVSDFVLDSDLTGYVTTDTPQGIFADKSFAANTLFTIYGNESNQNNTQSFNITSGIGKIASGWVNTFYGNRWKYGIVRGGASDSTDVKFGFDFSTDNGVTYERKFSIDSTTGNLELQNNGIIYPNGDIEHKQVTTAPNATGAIWRNKDGSGNRIAGIGVYTENGDFEYNYIGWGTSPWDISTSLAVSQDVFTYKGNNIWHSGNLEDYHNYGLGRYIEAPTTYNLDTIPETSILGINDNTTNRPFNYGSVWTHRKNINEFTQITVDLFTADLWTRGWSNGTGDTGWKKQWNSGNLPNPVNQADLGNYVNKAGDTMTGDLHALNITAQNASDKLIYDNIVNYGSPLKINANASLGIFLQANGTNILEVNPSVINASRSLAVTGHIEATGIVKANTYFSGTSFQSDALNGTQVFSASNANTLYFGNSNVTNVYYQALSNHNWQVNGSTIANVNSTGLYVIGNIQLNGQNVTTQSWVNSQKGIVNGIASLDGSGLIPATQLPSYVDDVLEFANLASFPTTGESGKIYVAIDTNKTYRWSGSAYIYITSGAVDSVNGQTGVVNLTKTDIGLANIDNTSDAAKNVLSATKWTTPRTLSYTGDVTGSASVDGSGNVGFAMTLANSGVSAGTYNNVNVDAKGRVLSGSNVNYVTESYVADFLQQNYFNQAVSDERFVNTEGNETINGNKTFSSSPSIPAATSGEHAVNLEQLSANLVNVVNDNDDFKLLEVYKLIDSNPIDLDDTRIKKYNIVFDGSSNGTVNINHLKDNQYYQLSNIAGSGADLRLNVAGYGHVDIISSGKTAVYMSWGDGKLLKISENANVSII